MTTQYDKTAAADAKAFVRGMQDFADGLTINPYNKHDEPAEWEAWISGFDAAMMFKDMQENEDLT